MTQKLKNIKKINYHLVYGTNAQIAMIIKQFKYTLSKKKIYIINIHINKNNNL